MRLEDERYQVFLCPLSGRVAFGLTEACYRARALVRGGNAEALVMRGEDVKARFYRTPTGEVIQENGVHL